MVWGVVRTVQQSLKYRGGWKGLLEHMYTNGDYPFKFGTCMGVDAADITVTAVQNADGTWSVTAEVDAGEDSAGAAAAAEAFNALTPEELVRPSPSLS